MFTDEARIAAAIRHRNVVSVHELGRDDDELYLVMDYLEGESLAALMKRLRKEGHALPMAVRGVCRRRSLRRVACGALSSRARTASGRTWCTATSRHRICSSPIGAT